MLLSCLGTVPWSSWSPSLAGRMMESNRWAYQKSDKADPTLIIRRSLVTVTNHNIRCLQFLEGLYWRGLHSFIPKTWFVQNMWLIGWQWRCSETRWLHKQAKSSEWLPVDVLDIFNHGCKVLLGFITCYCTGCFKRARIVQTYWWGGESTQFTWEREWAHFLWAEHFLIGETMEEYSTYSLSQLLGQSIREWSSIQPQVNVKLFHYNTHELKIMTTLQQSAKGFPWTKSVFIRATPLWHHWIMNKQYRLVVPDSWNIVKDIHIIAR
jgi:hypothetical protein